LLISIAFILYAFFGQKDALAFAMTSPELVSGI